MVVATLLVLLLARLLGQAAAHLAGRQRWLYALFFAPGVALHELAHVFGCLLVGARVREVVLWRAGQGWVAHDPPRWRLVTQPLISFMPLLAGCAALLALAPFVRPETPLPMVAAAWLMASIGAALVPSWSDLRAGLPGLLVLMTGLALAAGVAPSLHASLTGVALQLHDPLMRVNLLLAGSLGVLWVLRFLVRR